MRIFIDDIRDPPEGWVLCRSIEEAKVFVMDESLMIDAISFDNDLGDGQPEGYTLLDQIEEMVFSGDSRFRYTSFKVHSANPVATRRMVSTIIRIYDRYRESR